MLKFFKKVMGNKVTRDMKALNPLVQKIHKAYETIKNLSNDELRNKTFEFKQRIKDYISEEENEIARLKTLIQTLSWRPTKRRRCIIRLISFKN